MADSIDCDGEAVQSRSSDSTDTGILRCPLTFGYDFMPYMHLLIDRCGYSGVIPVLIGGGVWQINPPHSYCNRLKKRNNVKT